MRQMKSANVKRNDGCREHKYAAEDMALNFTAAFQKDMMLNVQTQTKFRDRLEKSSTDKLQRSDPGLLLSKCWPNSGLRSVAAV